METLAPSTRGGAAPAVPPRAAHPGAPPRQGSRPHPRKHRSKDSGDRRFALLLMAPAALFLAGFVLWPLVRFIYDTC